MNVQQVANAQRSASIRDGKGTDHGAHVAENRRCRRVPVLRCVRRERELLVRDAVAFDVRRAQGLGSQQWRGERLEGREHRRCSQAGERRLRVRNLLRGGTGQLGIEFGDEIGNAGAVPKRETVLPRAVSAPLPESLLESRHPVGLRSCGLRYEQMSSLLFVVPGPANG